MTLTITPTVDTLVAQPRVRLDVVGTAAAPNPVGSVSSVAVFRIDPDGARRRVLIESGATLSAGTWAGFDYHAPFNQEVSYVAVVDQREAAPAAVTLPSTVSWLMHPNNPALSVQISGVDDVDDVTHPSTAVVSYAFAAEFGVSLWEGVRHAPASQVVTRIESKLEQQQLRALLKDSGPILLNLAVTDDDGDAWWDVDWAWVQPGDYVFTNPGKWLYYPERQLVMPFTVVDTPAGTEVPLWTVNDLMDVCPTGNDVLARYRTVLDLSTNTMSTAGGTGVFEPTVTPGFYSGSTVEAEPGHSGYFTIGISSDGSPVEETTEYDGGNF